MLFFSSVIIGLIILVIIKIIPKKEINYKQNNRTQYYNKNTLYINKNKEYKIDDIEYNQYCKKYLLTQNELYFYKNLKQIAEELNYTIITKVRFADLVEVKKGYNRYYQTAFNKISRKHIDFVLCRPENLEPILLIELDDNSHDNEKSISRDIFINKVCENTGYKILRTRGIANLKENINNILLNQCNT